MKITSVKNSRYRRGWFGDSHRHYLASKGIRTNYYKWKYDEVGSKYPKQYVDIPIREAIVRRALSNMPSGFSVGKGWRMSTKNEGVISPSDRQYADLERAYAELDEKRKKETEEYLKLIKDESPEDFAVRMRLKRFQARIKDGVHEDEVEELTEEERERREWEERGIKPPMTEKEAVALWEKELEEVRLQKFLDENGLSRDEVVVKPHRSLKNEHDAVTIDIRYSPKAFEKQVSERMRPVHSESNTHGNPKEPEKIEKYFDELAEAIASEEQEVNISSMGSSRLSPPEFGEGRHRSLAADKASEITGKKDMPLDFSWDYDKIRAGAKPVKYPWLRGREVYMVKDGEKVPAKLQPGLEA